MKIHLPLLLALATSLSAVPSDINYQGRLTDANGDAVTGDVSMSVKMYDAQSGGNEIYSEDIGTVTLDENGVYSFQFGASGNSTVTKTETIVTSDGTSTEYTGTFTSTPIDGTISVTDETYSWNDIDGNPGEQATAYIIIINGFVIYADIENGGSGYDDDNPPLVTITGDGTGASATATVENGEVVGIVIDDTGNNYTEGDIAIAPPLAPFTVDKVDGNLEVGYTVAPVVRTGVVATYKTLEPSIIGALSEASSHWLELTVDGIAQNPRERILSVPFAQVAGELIEDGQSLIDDSEIRQVFIEHGMDHSQSGSNVYDNNEVFLELKEGEKFEILYRSNNRMRLRAYMKGSNTMIYEGGSERVYWTDESHEHPIIIGPCDIDSYSSGHLIYKVTNVSDGIRQVFIEHGMDHSQSGSNVYDNNEVFLELKEGEKFEILYRSNNGMRLRAYMKGSNTMIYEGGSERVYWTDESHEHPIIIGPCDIDSYSSGHLIYKVSSVESTE